jgi:endo-alpha-1,4-polygalactosaminidase (GH114 family)
VLVRVDDRQMVDPRAPSVAGVAALIACAAVLAASCAGASHRPITATGTADLSGINQWWILLGRSSALDAIDWRLQARDTQMVILSDDPGIALGDIPRGTLRLGYLSVGEADPHKTYWSAIRDRPFLVETNPNWPDNMRVDIRDVGWQRRLLDEEVPRLLGRGFEGLMLDTIDTAPYLETKDPARYAGSREALRSWLAQLRRRHPEIVLLANGTEALADAGPFIDGYVVEGVFATYDFGRRIYRPTTETERSWKLTQIQRAQSVARHPVFTIEYASVGDVALARWAASESTRYGFRPYVTVKDINSLP